MKLDLIHELHDLAEEIEHLADNYATTCVPRFTRFCQNHQLTPAEIAGLVAAHHEGPSSYTAALEKIADRVILDLQARADQNTSKYLFRYEIRETVDPKRRVADVLNVNEQRDYNASWFEEYRDRPLASLSKDELDAVGHEILKDLVYAGVADFEYQLTVTGPN